MPEISCSYLNLIHKPRVCRHHFSTRFARSQRLTAIKRTKARQEIFLDVPQFEIRLVEWVIARITKPKQSVFGCCTRTFAFDDEAK